MKSEDDVEVLLERIGIRVPEADLPFLRRARQRQRELLDEWSKNIPLDAEPALVLRPSCNYAEEFAVTRRVPY